MNKELSCHELVLKGFNFWECNGTIHPRKKIESIWIVILDNPIVIRMYQATK